MDVHFPTGRPRRWDRAPRRTSRPLERIAPRVNVCVQVWDAGTPEALEAAREGRGRLISETRGHNRVPNTGRNLLRDLLNGDAVSGLTEFAIGTSATATSNNDTELVAEVLRDELTDTSKGDLKLTAQYFLSSTLLNGQTLREAGLFTDDDTLFARYVLGTPIAKTSAIAVTFTWVITFTVTELNISERGELLSLIGNQDALSVGNAYPAGATFDKLVPGSGVLYIDSADLQGGTFALEAIVKVWNGTAIPTIALFNLDDGAPNTALAGSAVAGPAGNQTGNRVRSGAITFAAAGAPKTYGVKIKTDEVAGEASAWGIRIVRLT